MINKQKKEEAKKQLETLQSEMDKLKAIIDAPEVRGRYIPKHGQSYFDIQSNGPISESMYFAGDETCTHHKVIGNCYETKEHAEQVAENRKTHVELQDLADKAWADSGEVIDWTDANQTKYYTILHMLSDTNYDFCSISKKPNCAYFPCLESCGNAIDRLGRERVKKYLEIGII